MKLSKIKALDAKGLSHHVLIAVLVVSGIAGFGAWRVFSSSASTVVGWQQLSTNNDGSMRVGICQTSQKIFMRYNFSETAPGWKLGLSLDSTAVITADLGTLNPGQTYELSAKKSKQNKTVSVTSYSTGMGAVLLSSYPLPNVYTCPSTSTPPSNVGWQPVGDQTEGNPKVAICQTSQKIFMQYTYLQPAPGWKLGLSLDATQVITADLGALTPGKTYQLDARKSSKNKTVSVGSYEINKGAVLLDNYPLANVYTCPSGIR